MSGPFFCGVSSLTMSVKAGWVTAMLHVRSVEKSIEFYRLLGFKLIDIEGHNPLGWARLHCDDGSAIIGVARQRESLGRSTAAGVGQAA
jgi:hypothetical protein